MGHFIIRYDVASGRFTVEETLTAMFDDKFGLSDGEWSDKEGKEIYPYLSEPVLLRKSVDEITKVIDDHHHSDTESSVNDNELHEVEPSQQYQVQDELVGSCDNGTTPTSYSEIDDSVASSSNTSKDDDNGEDDYQWYTNRG